MERAIFDQTTQLVTPYTVPAKILKEWVVQQRPMPGQSFAYTPVGEPIGYEAIDLEQPWETFNIEHALTRKGIQQFVADYRSTLREAS